MKRMRYVAGVLAVVVMAAVAFVLAPAAWRGAATGVSAPAAEAQTVAPKYELTIPKAWGKVIGYGSGNLLMEAPDGTLREVDLGGKAPEYPKVKTLVRWN